MWSTLSLYPFVCLSITRITWKVFKRFAWNFVWLWTTVLWSTWSRQPFSIFGDIKSDEYIGRYCSILSKLSVIAGLDGKLCVVLRTVFYGVASCWRSTWNLRGHENAFTLQKCTKFISVLQPYSIWWLGTPWTSIRYCCLTFVILINPSMVSFVHVLMLLIQAARGLPLLYLPGIVPWIISFSRQFPSFLVKWPQNASFVTFTMS